MILYFVGMCYMFVSLHIVCDDYFVASISEIVQRFGCDEDVAGATLMAASSSAPELFAGAIGVFVSGSEEVGVGTVVGSCVFNMCVIIGGVAIVYPHDKGELRLGGFSMARDAIFYGVAILLLLLIYEDNKVMGGEAGGMFGLYVLYVIVNWKFRAIKDVLRDMMNRSPWKCCWDIPSEDNPTINLNKTEMAELGSDMSPRIAEGKKIAKAISSSSHEFEQEIDTKSSDNVSSTVTSKTTTIATEKSRTPTHTRIKRRASQLWHNMVTRYFRANEETPSAEGSNSSKTCNMEYIFKPCYLDPFAHHQEHGNNKDGESTPVLDKETTTWKSYLFLVFWYIQLPIRWVLYWTIPDCRLPHLRDYYMISFSASMVWLGLLVYIMLEWAKKAGCLAGISAATMGLTFCAAGTSAPDCFISLIVAKSGRGKMACSNVFGSNIFDILLCLGFPLLLSVIIEGHAIVVPNDALVESVIVLFGLLAAYLGIVIYNKFVLPWFCGPLFLGCYLVYIIIVVIVQES
jgi:K+-dependent Na+/Ca+ exchanger-like protein